jgi:GMP synthase-like glutamine amidotransferase
MELAILETGRPPGDLAERFGSYPAMLARMLGDGFELKTYDVAAGELPTDTGAHNAYLITGSPAGVYEPLPWVEPLSEFIRDARDRRMVGVCFGHQVMAQALGGEVEKSDKGWGVGLHRYSIDEVEPWMDPVDEISVAVSHQDRWSPSRRTLGSSRPRHSRLLQRLPGPTAPLSLSSSTPNSRPIMQRRWWSAGGIGFPTRTRRSRRSTSRTTMHESPVGYGGSSRHRRNTREAEA